MIEVFKTNVKDSISADMLIEAIHKRYAGYSVNFDLHDCDNILRVRSSAGEIDPAGLILLLKHFGFTAEVLEDR